MSRASRAMLIAVLALGACTAQSQSGESQSGKSQSGESQSGRGFVDAAGKGKSLAEFRQDDADCRQDLQQYDARYAECLRAKGYRIVRGSSDYPLISTGLLPAVEASGGNR
jgi:hypothetical protein